MIPGARIAVREECYGRLSAVFARWGIGDKIRRLHAKLLVLSRDLVGEGLDDCAIDCVHRLSSVLSHDHHHASAMASTSHPVVESVMRRGTSS
jgi:hypothetical protein